jgi:hypothetical protein
MDDKTQVIANPIWTPEIIVNLVGELAWPIAIIILGWRFRAGIINAVSNFLSNNNVSEISASATGVTAKFKEAQQSAEIKGNTTKQSDLPEGASLDELKERQAKNSTEFSLEQYTHIKNHVASLGVDDEEKIELLSKELSLVQVGLRFFHINKVLFRSQFDLLNGWFGGDTKMSEADIKLYFTNLVKANPDNLVGWDHIKYLTYPISTGLIVYQNESYSLTKMGNSYVEFMKKNIGFIDELSKL